MTVERATRATGVRGGSSLLEVSGLSLKLGGTPVLRGVDLAVAAGEVVGLVGPNGAGKSSLLRAVSGVLSYEAGAILIDGAPAGARPRTELARMLAVVQQLPEAPESMLVAELVLLGRYPHLGLLGRESGRDYIAADRAMERAGCLELAARSLDTLSGGERRRAFIARALAQETPLLLLDEPTANLDASAQAEVMAVLRELAASGTAVLVVLHDLTLAGAYCDRLVMLDRGEIVAEGAAAEVITSALVRRVYGPHVEVIEDPRNGAPVVVPNPLAAHADGASLEVRDD
jgi:iron complex transport system ATP-binding protein